MLRELTPEQKSKPYAKYYYQETAKVDPALTALMNQSPMDPAKALPVDRADELFSADYSTAFPMRTNISQPRSNSKSWILILPSVTNCLPKHSPCCRRYRTALLLPRHE